MSEMPLVSVIVPVYNVEQYIEECIRSIQNQTYRNLEVIIVNDGTQDNSIKICEGCITGDERFRIIHEENSGLSAARNNGLSQAKGDYFFFIDSDDYIEENAIEELVKTIRETRTDICVLGTTLLINGKKKREVPEKSGVIDSEDLVDDFIRLKNGMIHSAWGKLYSSSIKAQVEFPVGRLYEDQFVTYNLVLTNSCSVTNQSTYIYRIREGSIITADSNIPKKTIDMMDSMKVVQDALKDRPRLQEAMYYKMLNDSLTIVKYCSVINLKNVAYEYAKQWISTFDYNKAKKYGISTSHIVQMEIVKYCYPIFKIIFSLRGHI